MQRWPAVDRELRRRLLDELRRRHNVEASERSPAARLLRLEQLRALARVLGRSGPGERSSGTDEPLELWRQMKARFRHAGGRR